MRIRRKRQPQSSPPTPGAAPAPATGAAAGAGAIDELGGEDGDDTQTGTGNAIGLGGASYCGALPFLPTSPPSLDAAAAAPTTPSQAPTQQMRAEAARSLPPSPSTTPDADAVTPTTDGERNGELVGDASPATATSSSPASNIDAPAAIAGMSLQPPAADDVLDEDDNSSRVFRTRQMVESTMHLQVRSVTMHSNMRRSSWAFGVKRRRPSEFRSMMKLVQRNTRERGPPPPE